MTTEVYNQDMKTDEEIKQEYRRSQGLDSVDIGSVKLLRKHVNKKLKLRGYKLLQGYARKEKLQAINAAY